MKRSAISLALLCAGLSVLAAAAMAHTKNYSGKTTLNNAGPAGLSGKLSSSVAACEKNRRVGVYSVGGNGLLSAVSGDVADKNGNWATGTGFFDPAGEYVVKVRAKKLVKNEKHNHKCKSISKRRDFGG